MVETRKRPAIVGVAQHRPGGEQLIEGQGSVKDVAAEEAEVPFEVEGRKSLAADDAGPKPWRVAVDRVDHEVGYLIAPLVP
jgi:hypothetical protein